MNHNRIQRMLAVAAIASVAVAACGGDDDSSDATTVPTASIVVTDVWARTSPMVATAGAAYLTITNGGDADDALVKASVDPSIAKTVEIHETVAVSGDTTAGMGGDTTDGTEMMEMRPVDRIVAPANGFVTLAPGGYHIMLLDLVKPLAVGSTIDIVLTFEQSGEQTVTAQIRDTAP